MTALLLTYLVFHIDLNNLYHIDIKIQKVRKYFPFVVINNMKCIKYYAKVSKTGCVKELQGVYEFPVKSDRLEKYYTTIWGISCLKNK